MRTRPRPQAGPRSRPQRRRGHRSSSKSRRHENRLRRRSWWNPTMPTDGRMDPGRSESPLRPAFPPVMDSGCTPYRSLRPRRTWWRRPMRRLIVRELDGRRCHRVRRGRPTPPGLIDRSTRAHFACAVIRPTIYTAGGCAAGWPRARSPAPGQRLGQHRHDCRTRPRPRRRRRPRRAPGSALTSRVYLLNDPSARPRSRACASRDKIRIDASDSSGDLFGSANIVEMCVPRPSRRAIRPPHSNSQRLQPGKALAAVIRPSFYSCYRCALS